MESSNEGMDRRSTAIVVGVGAVFVLLAIVIIVTLFATDSDSAQSGVDANLTGKVWQWYELQDPTGKIVVDDPSRYTVEFMSDGTVSVQADCNRANGTYTADGSSIKIELGAMTMAMCPPESLSDEFVNRLNIASLYFFEANDLLIDLQMDSGTLKFAENPPAREPVVDPALIGKTWKWFEFQDPVGKTVVDNPSQYTVEFMSDGTVSVQADCNRANGTYTANGSSINIELGAMTMAMCPPESLSDDFIARLNAAALYFFEGDVFHIDLMMDSGTMKFAESPPPPPPTPTQAPPVDPALIGKVWKWFEFQSSDGEKITVNNPNQYTVEFMADGSVSVQADCNRANGTHTADGSNINIDIGAMTRAACPPGSYSDQFVNLLNTAAIYFFQGSTLLMDLPADSGTMKLSESPPSSGDPALIGPVWQWTEFRRPDGEQVFISDPTVYTVQFMPDGTLGVKADCNTGNGIYTADGSNINITIGAMTLAFCAEGSFGSQFVNALNAAAIYFFESGDLFMDLPMDSGTMRFKPQ